MYSASDRNDYQEFAWGVKADVLSAICEPIV
jgi:hypothetical protein